MLCNRLLKQLSEHNIISDHWGNPTFWTGSMKLSEMETYGYSLHRCCCFFFFFFSEINHHLAWSPPAKICTCKTMINTKHVTNFHDLIWETRSTGFCYVHRERNKLQQPYQTWFVIQQGLMDQLAMSWTSWICSICLIVSWCPDSSSFLLLWLFRPS